MALMGIVIHSEKTVAESALCRTGRAGERDPGGMKEPGIPEDLLVERRTESKHHTRPVVHEGGDRAVPAVGVAHIRDRVPEEAEEVPRRSEE